MRAAVLRSPGDPPEVGAFDDPSPADGQVVVDVLVAGLNPVDLYLASGALGKPTVPSVIGQEGVGRLEDGRRVYFNPSVSPYGSWAQRTLVERSRMFPVPDDLDDALAVAMGIPALAAWLPLEYHARLASGESVLVLGATGVVGRVAVQAAKILGAGRVVAAARSADALQEIKELGADEIVVLGEGDDAAALRGCAGDGFDIVIDPVYGKPFEAALGATATGARLVTIGGSAGQAAEVPFRALQGRTHIGHGNNTLPVEVVRDAYEKLAGHAAADRIRLDIQQYELDQAREAWEAQSHSPHRKLVITL